MATNNSVNVGLSGSTGTGNFVGSNSPTLVTAALGTPASGTLTNCTQTGRLVNIQVFTASGANTYTPTSGVTKALVKLWGAGGGGGTTNSATINGGGGGAGEYAESLVAVSGAVTINIGTGGTGQLANNGTAGTAGGNTTYNSTTVVAVGGSPGSSGGVQGAGGTGGTGTILMNGGSGGTTAGAINFAVGEGGSSPNNTPQPQYNSLSIAGQANTGQGGSGGNSGNNGGAGGSGLAIVYEYN